MTDNLGTNHRLIRISLFIGSLSGGGAERQLASLAIGLIKKGHQVSVIVLTPSPGDDALCTKGVKVVQLRKGRIASTIDLVRHLRDDAPRVVISYFYSTSIRVHAARIISRRDPAIVWSIRSSSPDWRVYPISRRVVWIVAKRFVRFADGVIFNSQTGRTGHAEANFRPSAPIAVVPNGVDLSEFPQRDSRSESIVKEFKLAQSIRVVACIGRLHPKKGQDIFIDAIEIVARQTPQVVGLVCGRADYWSHEKLRHGITARGLDRHVKIVPERSPISELLRGIDLLVVASRFGEGFSNVIAEAMSTGVPVVSTDTGDARHIIGDDRCIAHPDDPQDLARVILDVLDFPPDGNQQRKRVARFSLERLTDATEDFVLSLT